MRDCFTCGIRGKHETVVLFFVVEIMKENHMGEPDEATGTTISKLA